MQEFTFHYRNFLGGGPPKPPIAGGGHPLPHTPFACKNSHPLFKTLATGLHTVADVAKGAIITSVSARAVNVEHNIHSFLLQNSLQSAKKYTGQVQQKRQSSPVKTTTNCVMPAPIVSVKPNGSVPSPATVSSKKEQHRRRFPS
ncbi:hypothetical protein DPMN_026428 [Dreissena polymorpha]|uniref:Uncharacterized protein n=1 Tax=Dreissena polymorpha TaxID=45954 RepID=A0A9D4LT74_DREPO|nr:hypothetical protein DPMN_026428 [Dreissena polymorpha]